MTFEVETTMRRRKRRSAPTAEEPHVLPSDDKRPCLRDRDHLKTLLPAELQWALAPKVVSVSYAEALCRAYLASLEAGLAEVAFRRPCIWTWRHCRVYDVVDKKIVHEKLDRSEAETLVSGSPEQFVFLGKPKHWPAVAGVPLPDCAPGSRGHKCHSVDSWLMDTGCGFDLIQRSDLREDALRVSPIAAPVSLATANGEVRVTEDAKVPVGCGIPAIEALVLDSTPAVLSIGRRCMREGYTFEWHPYQAPTLRNPDGFVVTLDVIDNVPYLRPASASCRAVNIALPVLAVSAPAAPGDEPPPEPAPAEPLGEAGVEEPGGDEEDEDEDAAPPNRDLRLEAVSLQHMLTHHPKNPWCAYCTRAKMPRVHCRNKGGTGGPPAVAFGDSVTADHIVLNDDESAGIGGMKYILVVYDRATRWVDAYALPSKSSDDAYACFVDFAGAQRRLGYVWSDNSPELIKALRDFGVTHGRATPYRPETNGVAERMNRTVLDGARTLLAAAGFPPCFWPYAVRAFCFYRNVTPGKDGRVAWISRHGSEFKGKLLPFGSLVDFLPAPPIRKEKPKMATPAVPGVMLGYWQNPGGCWNGEYLAAEVDDVRAFIAGGCIPGSAPRVHRVKEVVNGSKVGGTVFPLQVWYEFRTRLAQDRDVRGVVVEGGLDDAYAPQPAPVEEPAPPPAPDSGLGGGG